jgi:hypothetical protein
MIGYNNPEVPHMSPVVAPHLCRPRTLMLEPDGSLRWEDHPAFKKPWLTSWDELAALSASAREPSQGE